MKHPLHSNIVRRIGLGAAVMCGLAAAPSGQAAILVQELFDAIAGPPPGTDSTIHGKGDTSTSIGLTGNWSATNTGIYTASNFNAGSTGNLPGLPSNGGQNGGVWNRTNSWNPSIYATRALATPIDFSADQVLYFSVILSNPNDTSMGIGLSSGDTSASEFVGAGLSWNTAVSLSTGQSAGNASYISYGTLGASNGPYGIRAHEPLNSVNGAALIVGRITISATSADTIEIKRYGSGSTIEADPSLVTWSVADSYDTSMQATHLLLWMNGGGFGGGELDAIRFGTTWTDVVPEPATAVLGLLGLGLIGRRRSAE